MKAMFRHAHAGAHHEHHYISHLIHDERFWVGVGIALLIGSIIALTVFSNSTNTPTTYFPYF